MVQTTLFEEFIAALDVSHPWLLPALEAIEQTVSSPVRLLIILALMAGVVVVRQRKAAHAEGGLHQAVS